MAAATAAPPTMVAGALGATDWGNVVMMRSARKGRGTEAAMSGKAIQRDGKGIYIVKCLSRLQSKREMKETTGMTVSSRIPGDGCRRAVTTSWSVLHLRCLDYFGIEGRAEVGCTHSDVILCSPLILAAPFHDAPSGRPLQAHLGTVTHPRCSISRFPPRPSTAGTPRDYPLPCRKQTPGGTAGTCQQRKFQQFRVRSLERGLSETK